MRRKLKWVVAFDYLQQLYPPAELAELLGVTRKSIMNWITKSHCPRHSLRVRIYQVALSEGLREQ